MSFFKVGPEDVESFTVVTNPFRHFVTSSMGATGSVYVFARRSSIEKETTPLASFIDATADDLDLETTLRTVQNSGRYAYAHTVDAQGAVLSSDFIQSASVAFTGMLEDYMGKVTQQGVSARKQKLLNPIRFTPTTTFTSNTARKWVVKDQLSSYYRTSYPSAHWAYTNYNCLNFFTSSTVPSDKALLYPNIDNGILHEGFVSGTYTPSGAFSFDFYINPKYLPDSPDGEYKAGTIFHLSSTYAVSLVSGSAKDQNGRPLGFRIQLQLSHSADIAPSVLAPGSDQNRAYHSGGLDTRAGYASADLAFLSDDNSLLWNHWHHVVVRWGGSRINDSTGSFVVDRVNRGNFAAPTNDDTVAPRLFVSANFANPDVLCIGNYYDGHNDPLTVQAYFFSPRPALRDGLQQLIEVDNGTDDYPTPTSYTFNHPLNAQVHDLAIKRFYMTDFDIDQSSSMSPKSIDSDIAFYLPPFFVEESPFRQFVGNIGGILQTPFFEVDGTTNDPFNVAMSFGVAGHYINVENFVRDFASDVFPRLHHMTGVAIMTSTEARSANDFLYDQPFVRARNLFIMPCDDGLFVPSFELLGSESMKASSVDDHGIEDLSFIHLDELVLSSSLLFGSDFDGDLSYVNESIGFTPEQPGLAPGRAFLQYKSRVDEDVAVSGSVDPGLQMGAPLTVYQRTRDPSSNQVTFFDISNLFYGKRILPGSLELIDPALSGSGGAVTVTLKDDGFGTVYRADSFTSASTWNAVGTIFYDEGIIAIKSPHLYFFGKEGYEISFKGSQNIHVMTVDVIASANQLNSSSNPNFVKVPPSPYANDPEKEFVYITQLNFHDDNFNVIMKTQLAQPIMKRNGDRIMFKIKHDF